MSEIKMTHDGFKWVVVSDGPCREGYITFHAKGTRRTGVGRHAQTQDREDFYRQSIDGWQYLDLEDGVWKDMAWNAEPPFIIRHARVKHKADIQPHKAAPKRPRASAYEVIQPATKRYIVIPPRSARGI